MATDVDVIIAVHDPRRPVARAVRSALGGRNAGGVRVTIVCHELTVDEITPALDGIEEANVRLVEFSDGIRSAAGPFNRGLDESSAEYVCIMGSDDFLEPGAMDSWQDHVAAEQPAAALARLRYQNGVKLHNPLARPFRKHDLDVVKDRVFYRTAPLGLIRRDIVRRLGLRFRDGFATGDDLDFGVRLWASGNRIDYLRSDPCYVIGSDAPTRVTTGDLTIEDSFQAINALIEEPFIAALEPRVRRALAIKLIRIHILGAIARRRTERSWRDRDELKHARETLERVTSIADEVLAPFTRADRIVLDTLSRDDCEVDQLLASVERSMQAGFVARNVTKNVLYTFSRESTLRRYALYALAR
jgi:hypothetical protein